MLDEATLQAQDILNQAFDSRRQRLAQPEAAAPMAQAPTGEPHGPVGDTDPLVEATFNKSLSKFLAALGGRAKVTSGKRSTQRQAELWEQALKKYGSPEIARKWVAPPGKSKHEQGLAADLGYVSPEVKAEAHRLARQYGLHFPLANEDWHVEPIGSR